jgi:rare lipoprotein A
VKVRRITAFGMGILIAAISCSSSHAADTQTGIASVYSGEQTANGEYAHASALTAAHRNLPFGTMVKVTNTQTDRSVVVRINDRGPFIRGRVIDLTPAGARAIGSSGLAPVRLTVLSVGIRGSRSDRSIKG